jgi:murein DD-endopeptidase MepM/ murein hydrolase activator NlpD
VLILHGNGWVSLYAHNYRNTVQAGWRVSRGERIGFVGSTGIARGPHLHFELRRDGRPVNPRALFDEMPTRDVPRAVPSSVAFAPADLAAPRTTSAGRTPRGRTFEPGSRRTALSLLRRPAPAEVVASSDGRVFRNLLWPLRGGEAPGDDSENNHHVRLDADEGTAVRATADAMVVFVGRLPARGRSVVLLHKNGWVTVYGSVRDVAVEAGQTIQRGQWLGFVDGGEGLRFELVDGGRPRDPLPLFVGAPA